MKTLTQSLPKWLQLGPHKSAQLDVKYAGHGSDSQKAVPVKSQQAHSENPSRERPPMSDRILAQL